MNRKFSLDPDHVLLLTNRKRKLPARQEEQSNIQGYVMNEKDMAENTEIELELVDLGSAASETRQWNPWQITYDNALQLSRPF